MNTLLGIGDTAVRTIVDGLMHRQNVSTEQFFETAAEKYVPKLKPSEIKRAAKRYEKGCAAPKFVKDFLLDLSGRKKQPSQARIRNNPSPSLSHQMSA